MANDTIHEAFQCPDRGIVDADAESKFRLSAPAPPRGSNADTFHSFEYFLDPDRLANAPHQFGVITVKADLNARKPRKQLNFFIGIVLREIRDDKGAEA